jgi:hypothetical protein
MSALIGSEASKFRLAPVEITSKGLTYRQMKRVGQLAIYEVLNRVGRSYGFEVVVLKVAPAFALQGRSIPAREAYPSSEQFGSTGWYFQYREDADQRFNELLDASKRPHASRPAAVLIPGP